MNEEEMNRLGFLLFLLLVIGLVVWVFMKDGESEITSTTNVQQRSVITHKPPVKEEHGKNEWSAVDDRVRAMESRIKRAEQYLR
jgi:hypothetical protein